MPFGLCGLLPLLYVLQPSAGPPATEGSTAAAAPSTSAPAPGVAELPAAEEGSSTEPTAEAVPSDPRAPAAPVAVAAADAPPAAEPAPTTTTTVAATAAPVAATPPRRKTVAERNEPIPFDEPWPHTFPLFGDVAHRQKRRLQLPWGIGVNYIYFSQPVIIEELQLSANDNPVQTVDFIEFGEVRGQGNAVNIRADWWILPFLNVYAMTSYVRIATPVHVIEPIDFTTEVPFDAVAFGGGATLVGSMGPLFLSMDFNAQATYIPKNEDITTALVTAPRFGYNHTFKNTRYGTQLSVWVGAMYTTISAATSGTVTFSDVVPEGALEEPLEAFRETLSPPQQIVFDRLIEQLQERPPRETRVNYALTKRVRDPWNMIVGANVQITPRWALRTEFGFIGRYQFLFGANYRFGTGMRAKRQGKKQKAAEAP